MRIFDVGLSVGGQHFAEEYRQQLADSADLLTGKKVFELPPCSVAVFETRKA